MYGRAIFLLSFVRFCSMLVFVRRGIAYAAAARAACLRATHVRSFLWNKCVNGGGTRMGGGVHQHINHHRAARRQPPPESSSTRRWYIPERPLLLLSRLLISF